MRLLVMGQRLKNFGGLFYGLRFMNIESLGAEHFLGWLQSIVSHLKFNVNFGTYTFLESSYVLSDF